jgi:hypothetical protein
VVDTGFESGDLVGKQLLKKIALLFILAPCFMPWAGQRQYRPVGSQGLGPRHQAITEWRQNSGHGWAERHEKIDSGQHTGTHSVRS